MEYTGPMDSRMGSGLLESSLPESERSDLVGSDREAGSTRDIVECSRTSTE